MTFKNEKSFRDWLINILDPEGAAMVKEYDTYFEEYLADVESAIGIGNHSIEVSSYYTKSHLPEEYYFGIEYDMNGNCTVTF